MILESKTYIKDQNLRKRGGSRIGQKKTVGIVHKPYNRLSPENKPQNK